MTTKQITTLVLFSQNYSLVTIAKKQKVSLTTIRQRIKALSKNHQREFNNALGIREAYKRIRDSIRNPMSLELYFIDKESQKTAKFFTNYTRDIDESKKLF
jgi:predicted DNA-binding protein YlxM (UPF0122 family)